MGRLKTNEERLRKKAMKSIVKQLSKGRPMPRQLKEINDEYSMACAKLGALTYQITVHEGEKQTLLEKIKNLNLEASERNKLDKEEAAKASTETGAPDVQA